MAGIYIPGMEIAEHCIDCPFMVIRDNDDCILQSEEANANFGSWDDMRKGCPLIPVPDHGDLIDRKKMRDYWLHASWDCPNMDVGSEKDVFAVINAVPVVLPGEEGENDH